MKYLKILYIQVLIGIVLGILTGCALPNFAPIAKLISETFINSIHMVIAPVIFFTIVSGIAGAGDLKKAGRVGLKSLIYFEVVTVAALILGLLVADLVKPGQGVNPVQTPLKQVAQISKQADAIDWAAFFSHIVPVNVIDAFAKGEILQVLFFSILFAIGLKFIGASGQSLLVSFEKINKVLFSMLHLIMKASPIGAFGGIAYTVGRFGFGTLGALIKLLVTFYFANILFVLVILNGVCIYYKINLWKLLIYIKEEILIVLGASSSEVVLPAIMQKLTDAGCDNEIVGLVIPTGYSFNLDGTSIYLTMSVIFLSQVFHIELSLGQQLILIGILLLTSKGAAGITGGGFIVLASSLTALKIIPIEGLGLLIGVDRFLSEGRAIINVVGNTVATVIISKSENEIDLKKYELTVNKKTTTKVYNNHKSPPRSLVNK